MPVPVTDGHVAIWLDVDGTCELGSPTEAGELEANRRLYPPLGRDYNYNCALFDALEAAGPAYRTVVLFTAYRAGTGASTLLTVLRCELVDWLERERGFAVAGVATLLDPIYGRGPGRYFADVIRAVERTLLASGREKLAPDDVVPMADGQAATLREVFRREEQLIQAYWKRFGHAPNKAELARYCLSHGPSVDGVLFLDDRPHYLEEVRGACESLGVDVRAVHVHEGMSEAWQYTAAMGLQKAGGRGRCAIS